ncbi:hypothetical protein [Burkholderia sp. TSV86]|uniref:hypothetical protein n=1 Tax=Burkholderia sp. TSV86 TaxID=1385594 RepID=UPI0012E3DD48|nr:hypothetical protein [Burkholderia sp. TSV86]
MFHLLNMDQGWMLVLSTARLYKQTGNCPTRKNGFVYGLKTCGCCWISVDAAGLKIWEIFHQINSL